MLAREWYRAGVSARSCHTIAAVLEQASSRRVSVVVLNWNGWRDTVACLQSLLALEGPPARVFVCDNGSTDGSVDQIERWASDVRWPTRRADTLDGPNDEADLVLVLNGVNLGFAGGNNRGIQRALACSDIEWVWLLNNDTVVEPSALRELLARVAAVPGCGVCGSTLVDGHRPDRLEAVAGRFNRWFARTAPVAAGMPADTPFDDERVTAEADFIVGASMLLSRALLERLGGLDERYFLYFEELDLAYRARGQFAMACATRSRVRHQRGASINPARSGRVSGLADYYFSRARILFTLRHQRWALPTVIAAVVASAVARIARGRPAHAVDVLRGLRDGLLGRTGALADARQGQA
jgi:GT2 family glycosyltransferase